MNRKIFLLFAISSCSLIDLDMPKIEIPEQVENTLKKSYSYGTKLIPYQIRQLLSSSYGYLTYAISPDEKLNYQGISKIPYATILVTYKNTKAIMVLSSENNGIMKWVSADGIVIFTFKGKVIQTIGLTNDIYISRPFNISNFYYENHGFKKYDDMVVIYSNPNLVSKSYSTLYMGSDESMLVNKLSKRNIKTRIIYEEFYVSEIRYKKKNKYWINSDGYILKSRQYLTPGDIVEIEVLKPFKT